MIASQSMLIWSLWSNNLEIHSVEALDQRDQINILGLANISLGDKWSFIRIRTKFSVMLSNRKWTYIEVAPILRLVNNNLYTIYFETWYRDHAPITLSAIRKGQDEEGWERI